MPSHSWPGAITIEEAKPLAQLYGIRHDLVLAHALTGLAECDVPGDIFGVEGIVSAAIVRYGRCFKSGVRDKFCDAWLAKLSDSEKTLHKYFIDLRDKYIAHSVNLYEDIFVTATITVKDGEKLPITSVNEAAQRVVLSVADAKALNSLIYSIREIIDNLIEAQETLVLARLGEMSVDEQHQFKIREPLKIGPEDVGRSRRR